MPKSPYGLRFESSHPEHDEPVLDEPVELPDGDEPGEDGDQADDGDDNEPEPDEGEGGA